MNIKEIAKRAGVSTATVSRAINRIPTVDPHLAKRVWKIVDELGYYPDKQARALVSGQSRIFGLIVSDLTNPLFSEVGQAFDERASATQLRNSAEFCRPQTRGDGNRGAPMVRGLQ